MLEELAVGILVTGGFAVLRGGVRKWAKKQTGKESGKEKGRHTDISHMPE